MRPWDQGRTQEPVHAPNGDGGTDEVPKQALKLAGTMMVNSPGSPEQTIAIRKVHEALMHFNLAVRLEKTKPLGAAQ